MMRRADSERATVAIGREEEDELLDRVREGIELHRAGKLEEARDVYKGVLAVQPCNASALNFLGVLAHQRRQHPEAERLIATAVAFDPQYADAYNNLGNVFDEQGKTIEAGLCYQKALQIRPDFKPALVNLAVVLRKMKRFDESARMFKRVLEKEPDNYEALHNYSMLLLATGDTEGAISHLRRAVQINPCGESLYAMGMALYAAGQFDEAGEVFFRWRRDEPDDPVAQHMAPAYLREQAAVPERASDGYVRAIFNRFARSFESVLAGLDYRVPDLIGEAVAERYGEGLRDMSILDAGCGTGLCGAFLRPYAARLVGVDLSPGMLAEARATEDYHELVEAELTEYLAGPCGSFDLVIAADVLCYFGLLEPVFAGVASRLKRRGSFMFTLELNGGAAPAGYHLNFHGRYSHTRDYVQAALQDAELDVVSMNEVELRRETGKPVAGLLTICTRGSASGAAANRKAGP